MALSNIYVGDYGYDIDTSILQDGAAFSCSWVTTATVTVKDPDGNKSSIDSGNIAWVGDQSLGVLRWTIPSGLLDESGSWSYQIVLTSATRKVSCSIIQFPVEDVI